MGKRAAIVLGSTAAGLGLVLSFHTHAPTLSQLSTSAGGTSTTTTPDTTTPNAGPSTSTPSTSPPATSASKTVDGQDIGYRYGDLELRVTETGRRITNITVLRNGAVDFRSEEINQQAVPLLQQQALSAQSANIDGVSGATFTSEAYAESLQSALDQLSR